MVDIPQRHIIINAVLFQVCWFAAILYDWLWALPALVALLIHSALQLQNLRLFLQLAAVSIVGIALDTLMSVMGFYQFEERVLVGAIPLWLAFLWLGFSLTLPMSLAWLVRRPVLFVGACSLMGPLSYAAGRRLGVMHFDDVTLVLIAFEWLVISCTVVHLFGGPRSIHLFPVQQKQYG